MSSLEAWTAAREPAPPTPLAAALAGLAKGRPTSADALAELGRERLERALAEPGRRDSAYRLLEADALFTYACEAALTADDPAAALRRILSVASR